MTWFKVDDQFSRHPKVRRAAFLEPLSPLLWLNAGVEVSANNADGVVAAHLLPDYAHLTGLSTSKVRKAIAALVDAGLWHSHSTLDACARCSTIERSDGNALELAAGDFYFHDWNDYQWRRSDTADALKKEVAAIHKRLRRDTSLCNRIRERDRDCCRYCGVEVSWEAHTGARAAQYDFVDPWLKPPIQYGNVVVACGPCNKRKGRHTPDQVGMKLLEEPGRGAADAAS